MLLTSTCPEPTPIKALAVGNLRSYNNAFAFTSFVHTAREAPGGRSGPMDFQIHGSVYHLQGPLEPQNSGQAPAFAQLYFHDPQAAMQIGLSGTPAQLGESCG